MGRQTTNDPTNVGSSIALLQERFRQLERAKEKREERALLKLFSQSDRLTTISRRHSEPDEFSFQRGTSFPSNNRPTLQDWLSLGNNLHSKHAEFEATRTPSSLTNQIWSSDASSIVSASQTFENSDVDTSLRL